MISAEIIAGYFSLNHRIIHRQIEGLTHDDSLLQPPFRGNCLNWVLGHIMASRNGVLSLLGEAPILSEEEAALYASGSEPITSSADKHLHFDEIVSALDAAQKRIDTALEKVTPEDLARLEGERTVGQQLAGLFWHEGYHTGQTGYLRQLAGKNDKVI